MNLSKLLFTYEDNTRISIWRILFGLVLVAECFGSIAVGWAKQVFIDPPEILFTFIGFEWLNIFHGSTIYWYFSIMGVLGICITLGYRYRLSMILFTLGWAGLYFMHKSSYNNHHYLLLILCLMMSVTPGHLRFSLDSRNGRVPKSLSSLKIFRFQYILLLLIVYTYASVAKWYPDWIDGSVMDTMLTSKKNNASVGKFYQMPYMSAIIAWGGILFDLFIIPMMMWSKTRKFAFVLSIGFHLFNSITFEIGTFPYMMIASAVLFFPTETIQKVFRVKSGEPDHLPQLSVKRQKVYLPIFLVFFSLQILLPLRHHLFTDNVLWTEEGHRLSWRMMLRSKSGSIYFRIHTKDGQIHTHSPSQHLSQQQFRTMATHPDMIWQYVQHVKSIEEDSVKIYAISFVGVNGRDPQRFVDPEVDLSQVKWERFKHADWLLPFQE